MNESRNNAPERNGTKAASRPLGDALHDADLIQISSDPLARTVTLVLDIEHLREFAKVSSGVTWRFMVHSVSMLLARRWEAWPGPTPELNGLSHAEQCALVAEYQAKGRMVSVAWSDFERAVNAHRLCTQDATLHQRDSDLVLEGYGHDSKNDTFFEFKLVGAQLQCERSDGRQGSLDELLRLGEAYWENFSKRAS